MNARWMLLVLAVSCQEYDLHGSEEVISPGGGPLLLVEPPALDFGTLDLGDDHTETVTITNVGDGSLSLEPLVLADPQGVFTLTPLDVDTLAAEESTSFDVTFAPNDAGTADGAVTVASDAAGEGVVDVGLTGEGLAPIIQSYEVEIFLTADDEWDGWVDGNPLSATSSSDWTLADTIEVELQSGEHVLALHARDQNAVVSGMIAVVAVDGVDTWITGDAPWRMSPTQPAADWMDVGYDDSGWGDAATCADQGRWGTYWPEPFYNRGAEWIWWTDQCTNLQSAWFRLAFTLP